MASPTGFGFDVARRLCKLLKVYTLSRQESLEMPGGHTRDPVQAIDCVIHVFPPSQQTQIKLQLATSLNAIVSQQLLTRADGGAAGEPAAVRG